VEMLGEDLAIEVVLAMEIGTVTVILAIGEIMVTRGAEIGLEINPKIIVAFVAFVII